MRAGSSFTFLAVKTLGIVAFVLVAINASQQGYFSNSKCLTPEGGEARVSSAEVFDSA